MAKASRALPAEPSKADRKAQAEEQTPLEPVGPGVEHEDHEGGLTDSLAKKGARAVIEHEKDGSVVVAESEGSIVRAPSVRERQTGTRAAVVQGGFRGQRARLADDASPKEQKEFAEQRAAARGIQPGSKIVPVIATAVGQYPHDGRLRYPGEAFDYILGPDAEELPSWMRDATGDIPSRDLSAPRAGNDVTATIQVRRDGSAEVV